MSVRFWVRPLTGAWIETENDPVSTGTAKSPAAAAAASKPPIAAPTITPTPGEVRAAFLKRAHDLRPDALDRAKERHARIAASVEAVGRQGDRSKPGDWPTGRVCQLLDERTRAAADVAMLEAIAAGQAPDTSPSGGPSSERLLELYAGATGYNGLALLVRAGEAQIAADRRILAHDVPAGIQFPVARYTGGSMASVDNYGNESVIDHSANAGDLDAFEAGALPLIRQQIEAEYRLGALEPALAAFKASLPGKADAIVKALGGRDVLAKSLREAHALSGAHGAADDVVEVLRGELEEVEAELRSLAGVGADDGLVAQDLKGRRDELKGQIDARIAEVRAGFDRVAQSDAAKVAAGDLTTLSGVAHEIERIPRAFVRGAAEVLTASMLEALRENAPVWRWVLEQSTRR